MTTDASYIESHYTNNNLFELIIQALENNGIPQHQVTIAALAAVDEFHVRGQEVSLEMATLASLQPGMQVLDVGCGIGGACRLLADTFKCTVTGIDITAEYIRTAQLLSALVGWQHTTRFVQGNALHLPFADGFFDVVWTQHVQMNIADKTTLYTQISRVLKSTGRFIYYDVLSKSNQPIYYPVPWAGNHTLSHLINSQQLQQQLQQAGLQRIHVQDETQKAIAFLQKALPRLQTTLPPVGLHLLMGPDAVEKLSNLYKSLTEGSLMLECGLYSKHRLAN